MASFYNSGRRGADFQIYNPIKVADPTTGETLYYRPFKTVKEMTDYLMGDKHSGNTSEDVPFGGYCLICTDNKNDADNGKLYFRGYEGLELVSTLVGPAGTGTLLSMNEVKGVEAALAAHKKTHPDAKKNTDWRFVQGEYSTHATDSKVLKPVPEEYNMNLYWIKEGNSLKEAANFKAVSVGTLPLSSVVYYTISNGLHVVADPQPETTIQEANKYYTLIEIKQISDYIAKVEGLYYKEKEEKKYIVAGTPLDISVKYYINTDELVFDQVSILAERVMNPNYVKIIEYYWNSPGYGLVSGKTNDTIKYVMYSSYDDNNHSTSIADVGLQIPYPVIEFEMQQQSAYFNRSDTTGLNEVGKRSDFTNEHLMYRDDTDTSYKDTDLRHENPIIKEHPDHPFYEKWHIDIPKGKQGQGFENFNISDNGTITWDTKSYERIAAGDITNHELSKKMHWIDDITLDSDEGKLVFDGNGDNTKLDKTFYLDWIKGISISENGTITYDHTNHFSDVVDSKKLAWIDDITLTPTNGHFTIDGNGDNTKLDKDLYLDWVKGISISQNGTVVYTHTHGKYDSSTEKDSETQTLTESLTWPEQLAYTDSTGLIYLTYNNENGTKKSGNINTGAPIRYLKSINLAEDGTFTYTTNITEDGTKTLGTLKWIDDISLDTTTGTLTIDGNGTNTALNKTFYLDWVKGISIDADGTVHYDHTDHFNDITDEKKLKWVNTFNITGTTGEWSMTFNNGSTAATGQLSFPKYFNLANNGELSYRLTTDSDETKHVLEETLNWLTDISVNSTEGIIEFTGNNNTLTSSFYLTYPNAIYLDAGTGKLTYTHTTDTEESTPTEIGQLDFVKDATYTDSTGKINFTWTKTGAKDVGTISYINSLALANDGKLTYTKNNSTSAQLLNTLKWITNTEAVSGEPSKIKINYNTGTSDIIDFNIDLVTLASEAAEDKVDSMASDLEEAAKTAAADKVDEIIVDEFLTKYEAASAETQGQIAGAILSSLINNGILEVEAETNYLKFIEEE